MQMEINIALGKNEGYMPSSVGGKSISVGRKAGSQAKIFTIQQLQFGEF